MYDKLTRRDERLRKREERAAVVSASPDGHPVQGPIPLGKAALWQRVKANGHRGT